MRRFHLLRPNGAARIVASTLLILPAPVWPQIQDTITARRECRSLDEPKKLPALAEVLDSTSLLNNLPTWLSPGTDVILALVRGARTEAPEVRVVSTPGFPDSAQLLPKLVQGFLRPTRRLNAASLRLHIGGAATPAAWLERSVLCGPILIQPTGVTYTVSRITIPDDVPEYQRRRMEHWRPTVSVLVGVDGRVIDVKVQPSSGIPDLDQSIYTTFRDHRYLPALLDGIPVEVWVTGKRVDLPP